MKTYEFICDECGCIFEMTEDEFTEVDIKTGYVLCVECYAEVDILSAEVIDEEA